MGAVACAVQVDLGHMQCATQGIDIVSALNGVIVVRIDAAFSPIRSKPASTRSLRIKKVLACEHDIEVVVRGHRIVEVRQCAVGTPLVEGNHVADPGEPFDVFKEAGLERTNSRCARSASQHEKWGQAMILVRGNAYERQCDGGTLVLLAARRHHEQATFGIETASIRMREP